MEAQLIVKNRKVTALKDVSILMAEDNELNAEITIELLEERGAAMTLAKDGVEVVDLFERSVPGDYQVILMDIQMPDKDGIEATSEIRALDRGDAAGIPIIAMTANAIEEQREEMEQAGMSDVLYKPIDLNKLCSCIRGWIT